MSVHVRDDVREDVRDDVRDENRKIPVFTGVSGV